MRFAESVSVGLVLAAAAAVSGALLVTATHDTRQERLELEPRYTCVIPDVTLQAPPPCQQHRVSFLTGQAPAPLMGEALTTSTGLQYVMVGEGCNGGGRPGTKDLAEVRFAGWNARGESIIGVTSATLPLDAVVPGFTEAVQLMNVGDQMTVWIPGYLAYERAGGHRDAKTSGTLTFEIELLGFTSK